jgi:hypothetical protein
MTQIGPPVLAARGDTPLLSAPPTFPDRSLVATLAKVIAVDDRGDVIHTATTSAFSLGPGAVPAQWSAVAGAGADGPELPAA